jgi:hypothetical protein
MKRHLSLSRKFLHPAAAIGPEKQGKNGDLCGSPLADRGQESIFCDWTALRSCILLTIMTLLCLVPFSGRAFHIDDPLFIWASKQIVKQPLDPYGFKVNWYMNESPMSKITKNPPLSSYYGAVIGKLVGWSERAFHLAFLLPALCVILGTYLLASRFCHMPMLAAAAALLTPGFLVSACTVMCDIMMLAFWVFAVIFWIEGLDRENPLYLFFACLLIAACAMTKYFGISLIPLLFVYALVRRQRLGAWAFYFLIPILVLAGYQIWTSSFYGRGQLLDAAQYVGVVQGSEKDWTLAKGLVCIGFIGGCMLPALTLAPVLWARWGMLIGAIISACAVFVIGMGQKTAGAIVSPEQEWLVRLHLAFFIFGGGSLLALAVLDLWKRRDAEALLLALWVFGTFVFGGFLNWTINARSILPLIPAGGILLVRRLETGKQAFPRHLAAKVGPPLLVSALLSLWVAKADADLADSARLAASLIQEKVQNRAGMVWFQGHWGFQYYMEELGGRPVDVSNSQISTKDFLVIPQNNNNTFEIRPDFIVYQKTIEVDMHMWLATMNRNMGAGFYCYSWGPLPFALGPVPPERYQLLRVGSLPGNS